MPPVLHVEEKTNKPWETVNPAWAALGARLPFPAPPSRLAHRDELPFLF